MSILKVTDVSFSFGNRVILENASFVLQKGEHIGLIGLNGEGKTTFIKMITGSLTPDEGKIEWCKRITTGYLDQYTTLTKGKTIREVLREAFQHMYDLEAEMNQMYERMGDCTPEEMEELLEETGGIVQGMSGSPILQNGKLVGAVTHVFVNNPTKGYGIFIENMLKEAEN